MDSELLALMELYQFTAGIGNFFNQLLYLITSYLQSDEVLFCGFSTPPH